MGIAIGGAAVSSGLCAWFAVRYPGVGGPITTDFLIYNLILVALNGRLLYAMWRHEKWAWTAALVLVGIGAIFDLIGVAMPPLVFVAYGALYLVAIWAPHVDWLASVAQYWLLVHVIVIQVPILVLQRAASTRQWFAPSEPAPAHR